MYVGLKQPRGDGERYVTPARAAAKETSTTLTASGNQYLRWLKTVSSTKILMGCYSHSLSLAATMMVSKKLPNYW